MIEIYNDPDAPKSELERVVSDYLADFLLFVISPFIFVGTFVREWLKDRL